MVSQERFFSNPVIDENGTDSEGAEDTVARPCHVALRKLYLRLHAIWT